MTCLVTETPCPEFWGKHPKCLYSEQSTRVSTDPGSDLGLGTLGRCSLYTMLGVQGHFPCKFPSSRPITRPVPVLRPESGMVHKPACTSAQVFLLARQKAWHKQKLLLGSSARPRAPTQGFTGTGEEGCREGAGPLYYHQHSHTDKHFPAFTL